MAKTTKEIQDSIIDNLQSEGITLSSSKTSEGRLWTFVVATAIHLFEVVLDLFRKEVDEIVDKITPGTARWYAERCRKWQNGEELLFDPETMELHYAHDKPETRLVSIVAIAEGEKRISIKVAKTVDGKITTLSEGEIRNLQGYIESIKFVGIETECTTATADSVRYNIEVYHSPSVPVTNVEVVVKKAIDDYRETLDFDSRFYRQRFIDAIMRVHGVVTVNVISLSRKGALMNDFEPIDIYSELEAGYFDFDKEGSNLTFKSAK